ncbi:MAG: hypothetical protein IPL62_13955 [Caulobacteraceae bacterium]|nr:hypothetical protein [Caulobacteraceae bacterium]
MLYLRRASVALISLILLGCATVPAETVALAEETHATSATSRTDPMWRMDFGVPLVGQNIETIPAGARSVECLPEDSPVPGLTCEFELDSIRFEVMSGEIYRKCAVLENRALPFGLHAEDDPATVIRRLNSLQNGLVFASSPLPEGDGIYVGAVSGSDIPDVVEFYVLFSSEGQTREVCIRVSNV